MQYDLQNEWGEQKNMDIAEGLYLSQWDPQGVTECPIIWSLVSISKLPSHKLIEMIARK